MKRLINSTAILSLALYSVPPAVQAQDILTLTIDGNEVICLPDPALECPEGMLCVIGDTPEACEAAALEALAVLAAPAMTEEEQAAADAAAAEAAKVAEEEAARVAAEEAAKAAEDAAAKAAEEAAAKAAEEEAARVAAEEAAKAAEIEAALAAEEAAAKAAEEEAAKAAEDAAAKAAEDAAAKAAEDAAAVAATEEAARVAAEEATKAAEVEAARAAEEAAAKAAEEEAAKAAEEEAAKVAEDAAAMATEAEAVAEAEAAVELPSVIVQGQTFLCLPDETTPCPDGALCVLGTTPEECVAAAEALLAGTEGRTAPVEPEVTEVPAEDTAAVEAARAAEEAAVTEALADPDVEVIDAPVPTEEAVEVLETALEGSTDPQQAVEVPEVAVEATQGADVAEDGSVTLTEEIPVAEGAQVTEEVVTEEETRASTEEFDAAPVTVEPGKKTGLSDFEKVGLVALGALIVGAMINGNRQVVSNTGDRVVVRQPDGSYVVYKDDNALLREPGSTVRTETFRDGSTRTIVTRADGSQIVTIRDATGRVIQRVAYDRTGHGVVLIDDTVAEDEIDVSRLPRVRADDYAFSIEEENAGLRAALAAAENEDLHHRFSLRQIRNIAEVRWLAPMIDVNAITFESGSAGIRASEARKLSKLGRFITDMIEENPRSLFLIEGHTDAVGSAASNLTLSDRRAESVAKALTEYFDVPPENLVVQGYGESELKIETLGNEERNRRVSVRIITDLLKRGAL
jgi:outer membrane protein OmpA-like peptidoglycan-associated protein